MIEIAIRNSIIFVVTMMLYTILMNTPFFGDNLAASAVALPVLITLAPVVVSNLPIMGTRDLMKGKMPSIFSSVILIGLAVGYPMLIRTADDKDPLKNLLVGDVELGGMKFSNKMIIMLLLILVTEALLQFKFGKN